MNNLYNIYDPEKIEIPKTDPDFWLALLRVRNHSFSDACDDYAKLHRNRRDHIWFTWLQLDFYLDKAFYEWRMAK